MEEDFSYFFALQAGKGTWFGTGGFRFEPQKKGNRPVLRPACLAETELT